MLGPVAAIARAVASVIITLAVAALCAAAAYFITRP